MSVQSSHSGSKCQECPCRRSGFCEAVQTSTLSELGGSAIVSTFPAGTVVLSKGEAINFVTSVRSGVIIVTDALTDGRRTIIELIEQGGFFGNVAGDEARFSYEAATSVVLCMIPRKVFNAMAHVDADLAFKALELSQHRAEAAQEWLTLFNRRTTLQRLAGYLSALATRNDVPPARGHASSFRVPIRRKDLAAFMGTTPQTLSRSFQKLAVERILKIVGGREIEIENLNKLNAVADDARGALPSVPLATRPFPGKPGKGDFL